MGFLQMVGVSETDERAEAEYFEHVKYFYEKMIHIYPQFNAPGYRSIETLRASAARDLREEQSQLKKVETWQDYKDAGYVIAGSPATVRDQLRESIKELRIGHLMLLLQIGNMPRHQAMKNMEMFAKEVMPGLKDIWEEYDDPWWPQAVPDRLQPVV
jgi:alkanesulfonate monooxygenase SsuD/methylene tetrahydromethanopterin reductase-like flavin-dependent oxidoreductase (luciferase family)